MTTRPPQPNGLEPNPPAPPALPAGATGPRYWRSLEELSQTEEFQDWLRHEFPSHADQWTESTSRRSFLKLMAASFALAGLNSGCYHSPTEEIVPYVRAPERLVPGIPVFYRTALTLGGFAVGVEVETHEGRPTKIEGNPDHPASLGGTDVFTQAAILDLYDPDRSQVVTRHADPDLLDQVVHAEEIVTWDDFLAVITSASEARRDAQGDRLRILTETVTSPSLAHQLHEMLSQEKEFPKARWHQYEPVNRDAARQGAILAFGRDVEPVYDFSQANVIFALDCDFLARGPGRLRYARQFTARRDVAAGARDLNRLYVAESSISLTGAMADHRWPIRPSQVAAFAGAVARGLGVSVGAGAELGPEGPKAAEVEDLVRDLKDSKNQGKGLILAGADQPPIVHALAHAMNEALGNVGEGKPVRYIEPVAAGAGQGADESGTVSQADSLRDLVRDMQAGQVDMLVILGANPVYSAPTIDGVSFAEAMKKVRLRIHLGTYEDETAALCHWHLPETHPLEAWGDARTFDGAATIQQPMIAPLYDGRSALELVSILRGQLNRSGYDLVRDYWSGPGREELPEGEFDEVWRQVLHKGVVAGPDYDPMKASPRHPVSVSAKKDVAASGIEAGAGSGEGLELIFQPDPTVWDGRFANNAWLQELPKPLTKLTWDNAALLSPAQADQLGVTDGQIVRLRVGDRSELFAVWRAIGHPDQAVTIHLGYGRSSRVGRVGGGRGFNAYALRTAESPGFASGLTVERTSERYPLACTQHHNLLNTENLEKRDLIQEATIGPNGELKVLQPGEESPPEGETLYPAYPYEGYKWGMTINLSTCIGCNACVVACQAENNIPVVGKEQVLRGREMHWLEIDRYYHGPPTESAELKTYFQPRLCMHCENAPCELVCPVAATVHDNEGINNMVYNRCVGTRYCSNNCPYKVRHFNFLQFSDLKTPSLKLMRNPDVTVRNRGVMEKCTYCIQRINKARYAAELEDRTIRADEVVTACQAACPTRAIVFGDLNNPDSTVVKLKQSRLNYVLLGELNTQPRTSYLAKLTNPNHPPETE